VDNSDIEAWETMISVVSLRISVAMGISLYFIDVSISFICLTTHKNKDYLYRARDDGADGYVLKDDPPESFHSAIKPFGRQKLYLTSSFWLIPFSLVSPYDEYAELQASP